MSLPTRFSRSSQSAAVGRARRTQREDKRANVRNTVAPNGQVFLNFRGVDTRCGFTSYLHTSLKDHRVRTFRDDQDLLGEEIRPGLFRAIADSQIAILVVSKNYGGSEWCLDELREILRCREEQGQIVLPVFYDINVDDVGELNGEFGQAFSDLANSHKPEKVQEWRNALTSLSGIGRWSLREDADWSEGKLTKMLVNRVLRILNKGTSVFPISSPATKMTLASHLRSNLKLHNISVFSDNDQNLIGKDLAHETRNAMEHCEIFIPIISKDLASSRDCLNKLAQMVECVGKNGQKMLPIFYEMCPSQEQVLDHFQEDMLRHKVGECTRQQWQKSLEEICKRSGLNSLAIGSRNEAKLVMLATIRVCEFLKKPLPPSVEHLLNL